MNQNDEKVSISFLGDIAFFTDATSIDNVNFDINDYVDIIESDFKVANYEFPFTEGKKSINKTVNYNHIPNIAFAQKYLREFKFDLLFLANNHINDWGSEGIETTKNILTSNGISTIGAGKNLEEATKAFIKEIKGIKFGFLSFSNSTHNFADIEKSGSNPLILNHILHELSILDNSVDFKIVNLHWGTEFVEYPLHSDVEIAHSLIENGADVIIGHHPHVIQGYELYKDGIIFYSLGSFIYSPLSERIKTKVMLFERCLSISVKLNFTKSKIAIEKITPFQNNLSSPFPKPIQNDFVENYINSLTKAIKTGDYKKLYYKSLKKNLIKREIQTVLHFIVESKGKYLFDLVKLIRLRHLTKIIKSIFT